MVCSLWLCYFSMLCNSELCCFQWDLYTVQNISMSGLQRTTGNVEALFYLVYIHVI